LTAVSKELLESLHGGLGSGALLSVGSRESLLAGADLTSGLLALGGGSSLLGKGRSELGNLGGNNGGNSLLGLIVRLGVTLGSGTTLNLGRASVNGLGANGVQKSDLGRSLLEVPVVLAFNNGLGSISRARSKRLLNGTVTEVLDSSLEFIVTVKVDGVASGVEFLIKTGLESVHNKADFEAVVGGEDLVGVDTLELKRPLGNEHNLLGKVTELTGRVLLLELVKSTLGEVGGHVEERVGDEEVGGSFLDEDLDVGLASGGILEKLGGITVGVDEVREKFFEGGHIVCFLDLFDLSLGVLALL
jgi:hypothetical protein